MCSLRVVFTAHGPNALLYSSFSETASANQYKQGWLGRRSSSSRVQTSWAIFLQMKETCRSLSFSLYVKFVQMWHQFFMCINPSLAFTNVCQILTVEPVELRRFLGFSSDISMLPPQKALMKAKWANSSNSLNLCHPPFTTHTTTSSLQPVENPFLQSGI